MRHEQQYIEYLHPRLSAHAVESYLSDMRAVERVVGEITPDILNSEQDVQDALLKLNGNMPPERIRNCGSAMRRYVEMVDLGDSHAMESLKTEKVAHGDIDSAFLPDSEGRARIRKHVEYERSRRNRAEAIRIHGPKCKACGFDFNAHYGATHAREYIEVHHVRSLAEQGERPIDPAIDLVTLCSNCHSMAHRDIERVLSVDELKELIERARLTRRR